MTTCCTRRFALFIALFLGAMVASYPEWAGAQSAPDAGVESGPDAGVETSPDAGVESAPDAGVESTPDAGVESTPDPVVESPPDPANESPPDPAIESPPDTASVSAEQLAIDEAAKKGEVIEIVAGKPPGSTHAVDEEELERYEHDDIHKILSSVPGVYIRQEDGFGLRPNIGMRGSGSERSAKIAIMEDGILSAPAPYSAPAAYYFPLVTRMTRVEVLKGPSSIVYGPNTVGGALNLVSRPIPRERAFTLDIAGGSSLYGKTHASYGESWLHGGVMVEAVKLVSSGFKELDGGGDTGFDKNDVLVKGRLNSHPNSSVYHEVSGKLNVSTEVSNETYTGLADQDFAVNPLRRYAGTQLDRMNWDRLQLQLSHRVEFTNSLTAVTTTVYSNRFSRTWRKFNEFNSETSLRDILSDPTSGNNAVFYAVLTGQADSLSNAEILHLGTNAREFLSQGIQSIVTSEQSWFGVTHNIDAGFRLHLDRVDRLHSLDGYAMVGGQLVHDDGPSLVTNDSRGQAFAMALHAQDRVKISNLEITAGLRSELINTTFTNNDDPSMIADGTQVVLIPGAGVTYQFAPSFGVLAGVHRGFAPAAPGLDTDVEPELSVNYEAGARWANRDISAEVIGFFSNYSNLKGTCTFSSGCRMDQVDSEFNGGRVHVFGVEASSTAELHLGPLRFPLKAAYTLNHARFQSAFSSENPQWGDVEAGDEVPYLPPHQLSLQAGVGGDNWEFGAAATYTAAMRDVAGQGEVEAYGRTEAATVLNLAGHYQIGPWGKLYGTVNNVLNQAHIVSRRPYGARPGVPRLVIVGYKNEF